MPVDPELAAGREVYRADCQNCHRLGKAGAPRFGDRSAWAPRIAKGTDTLVARALAGFESPVGNEMPARGGNDALNDEQVRAAVRFMIHHSQ